MASSGTVAARHIEIRNTGICCTDEMMQSVTDISKQVPPTRLVGCLQSNIPIQYQRLQSRSDGYSRTAKHLIRHCKHLRAPIWLPILVLFAHIMQCIDFFQAVPLGVAISFSTTTSLNVSKKKKVSDGSTFRASLLLM